MALSHQTNPTPTSLRGRIAELRLKQWRVAVSADIEPSVLSRILNDDRPADAETLARIARVIEELGAVKASA